jgi:hypothetical protein
MSSGFVAFMGWGDLGYIKTNRYGYGGIVGGIDVGYWSF